MFKISKFKAAIQLLPLIDSQRPILPVTTGSFMAMNMGQNEVRNCQLSSR